jgi:epoxide hydrolase-like predicted phosphatase
MVLTLPSDILISMTIKAVIFDLGGVLLRTADFKPRDQLAARMNMSRHKQAQRGEITIQEHWDILRHTLHYSKEEFKELLDEFFARDEIDGDLIETIRKLHQTYKTALLSNAWNDLRQTLHERWKLDGLFDELIISAEVKMVKPDPRIYHLAVDRLGVMPSEAVFIDDMAVNVEAARKEGLRAIWYCDTQQTMDLLNAYLSTE